MTGRMLEKLELLFNEEALIRFNLWGYKFDACRGAGRSKIAYPHCAY